MVTAPQKGPAAKLPAGQSAIAAANIRALRQRHGWTQAHLGHLMGWTAASTVCAAEGHRGDRQRRFARWEIDQLAAIFGIPAAHLLTRCATCSGQPPPGYACIACGAECPAAPARPEQVPHPVAGR
jgi:transcriptional regulator with XRE-family HTH domain